MSETGAAGQLSALREAKSELIKIAADLVNRKHVPDIDGCKTLHQAQALIQRYSEGHAQLGLKIKDIVDALEAVPQSEPLEAQWEKYRKSTWPDRAEEWSDHWKQTAIEFAAFALAAAAPKPAPAEPLANARRWCFSMRQDEQLGMAIQELQSWKPEALYQVVAALMVRALAASVPPPTGGK